MRFFPRVVALVLSAGVVVACGKSGVGAGNTGGQGARALPVKAGLVQVEDVVYRIQALGSLEPDEMVQVTAEVDGALTSVTFHEGDRVGPETVLCLIDPERYRLEAERAEATFRKAVADQQQAEADFRRREQLAKESLLSTEELTRARTDFDRLAAEASATKAARDIAIQNVARSQVRPRHAGVINTRLADTGQFVKAGTTLATLVDISRLRLRFKISEAESLQARFGQAVNFRVGTVGDREFSGQIYHVGNVADPTTRQVEVLAWVQNPGVLKPGFFAEVVLPSESRKAAIVIPETAVQASERGFIAFVIEDGKARLRPIQIGLRTGNGGVEITTGLKPGEMVITEGSDRLADGVPVRVGGETDGGPKPGGTKGSGGRGPSGTKGLGPNTGDVGAGTLRGGTR